MKIIPNFNIEKVLKHKDLWFNTSLLADGMRVVNTYGDDESKHYDKLLKKLRKKHSDNDITFFDQLPIP
jgi:hypothetical protein